MKLPNKIRLTKDVLGVRAGTVMIRHDNAWGLLDSDELITWHGYIPSDRDIELIISAGAAEPVKEVSPEIKEFVERTVREIKEAANVHPNTDGASGLLGAISILMKEAGLTP